MEISVDNLSSVKKVLHIEIPEKDVTAELDKAYQDISATAKIKGFRKGKVPRNVLERMFKKDVHNDVVSKLIQNSVYQAITKADLKPISYPAIEPTELLEKSPYKYDASVEITPELGEIDCKGLKLKKTIHKVDDKEIDAQVKMLQRNLAEHETIQEDRAICDGDLVSLNYEAFKDGEPFEEITNAEKFKLKIGEALISKDFDVALIGLKPNDTKDVNIKFPEDYFKESLAGLELIFKVKINEILKELVPEVDDEFLKKLGQFKTLDDLKSAIGNNLKQGYESRAEQELQEQIFKAILTKMDFELPDAMVNNELQGIISSMLQENQVKEMPPEELKNLQDSLTDQYRGLAGEQVKRHLILTKIADQEKLTLSDEDIEKGFTEMSARLNLPVADIKARYAKDQEGMEFFKQTLLEKDAMRFIIENSMIEEIEPEKEN